MDNKIKYEYIEISPFKGWDFYTFLFELNKHIKLGNNIGISIKTFLYGADTLCEMQYLNADPYEEHMKEEMERMMIMYGYEAKEEKKDLSLKQIVTKLINEEFEKIKEDIKSFGIIISNESCTIEDESIYEYEFGDKEKKGVPIGVDEQYLGIIKLDLYIDSDVLKLIQKNFLNKYNNDGTKSIDKFKKHIEDVAIGYGKEKDYFKLEPYDKYTYDKMKEGIFYLYYSNLILLDKYDDKSFWIKINNTKVSSDCDISIVNGIIKDNGNNIICGDEVSNNSKILREIYSLRKNGGITKTNLIKSLDITKGAFEKAFGRLKNDIKDSGYGEIIKIKQEDGKYKIFINK